RSGNPGLAAAQPRTGGGIDGEGWTSDGDKLVGARRQLLIAGEQLGEMLVDRTNAARSRRGGALKLGAASNEAADRPLERNPTCRPEQGAAARDQLIGRSAAVRHDQ